MSAVLPPAMSREEKLMFIGKAWQDGNRHCASCGFREESTQEVGLAEYRATQFLAECSLPDWTPDQCPALAAYRESLLEERQCCADD